MKNIVALISLIFAFFIGELCGAQTNSYGGAGNATQIQGRVMSAVAPTSLQVIQWNSTSQTWAPGAGSGGMGGSVLTVGSGAGLTGGPITVSGTLSVDLGTVSVGTLSPNHGGTGTSTIFTQGSMVFAGASGIYSQNNSQFFWNNSNSRLGIGTTSPDANLTIKASGSVGAPGQSFISLENTHGTATDEFGINFKSTGFAGTSKITSVLNAGGGTSDLLFYTGASPGNFAMMINDAQYVGIGTAAPGSSLDVKGEFRLSGATSGHVGFSAPTAPTSYGVIWPSAQGASSTFLQNDGSGNLSWTAGGGAVTSVASGTGLTGGTITSTGTLAVDVGTSANKIVQLTNAAKYPAVDGFLITNLNAANKALSNLTNPTAINVPLLPNSDTGQDLGAINSRWNSGYIVALRSNDGAATINIENRQILDALGTVIAKWDDGTFSSGNDNSVQLGEPGNVWQSAAITTVNSSNVTANSSLETQGSVKFGSGSGTANQVWTSSDTIGSGNWTDGFLITNLNALTALTGDVTASGHGSVAATVAKLQGVAIATTSPTSAQILTYNSTLAKWNPETASGGGGATTTLNNIGSTAMSADLVWASGTTGLLGTANRTSAQSADLTVQTGSSSDNTSGNFLAQSGSGTGTFGGSGTATFKSGNSAGLSGDAFFVSGNGANGNGSGNVMVSSGTATGNGSVAGDVTVTTGAKTGTGGNGGNIMLTVGTSASTQGVFKFLKAGTTTTAGSIWTASSTDGTSYFTNALLTPNSASASTVGYSFTSGNVTAGTGVSGPISLVTGDYSGTGTNTQPGTSGAISLTTGDYAGTGTNTQTGSISLRTGTTPDNTDDYSGDISLITGNSGWNSGTLTLATGLGTVADDAYSGDVFVGTGTVTGTARSGRIVLEPGGSDPSGGRGYVKISGHLNGANFSFNPPALSSCGGGSPSISGSDLAGVVVAGTATSACTITFDVPFQNAPACIVGDESSTLLLKGTASNTALVITAITPISGDTISYICIGNDNF